MPEHPRFERDSSLVSGWLQKLETGDEEALALLWGACFERAKRFADRRLAKGRRRAADEEDIAASAVHSLLRGARNGRFPRLAHRGELWKLLATLTARKISRVHAQELAAKRGKGHVRGESAFIPVSADQEKRGIADAPDGGIAPDLIVEMRDALAHLMNRLDDPILKQIAQGKLEGASHEELADSLQTSVRTIERKMSIIRAIWCEMLASDAT